MIRAVLVAIALLLLGACTRIEADALPNVKLGMGPGDVRARFEPGGEGTWQTKVAAAAGDTALEWKATNGSAKVKDARFEFHNGMLVAVRAQTREPAPSGESISATPSTVSVRRPVAGGEGTEIVVLSRDCPTHKDESSALAAKAK